MTALHPSSPSPTWLTPTAIARATGLAARRVRRWVAAGKIKSWRAPSGQWLIDPSAITQLLQEAEAARTLVVERNASAHVTDSQTGSCSTT